MFQRGASEPRGHRPPESKGLEGRRRIICAQAQLMMIDAMYGELDSGGNARLTVHLASCRGCQDRLGCLRSLLGTLDEWSAPPAHWSNRGRSSGAVISRRLVGFRYQKPKSAASLAVIAVPVRGFRKLWSVWSVVSGNPGRCGRRWLRGDPGDALRRERFPIAVFRPCSVDSQAPL